jgi:hypothetical protein
MLIIEDGAGVPDAESYATAAELVVYAGKFGVTVPLEEDAQEALLRRAALVMEGMSWKGRKTSGDQALAWPRRGVELDREIKPANLIPARIKYGQVALAAEIHVDDIDPIEQRRGAVTKEKVDNAVEREYAVLTSSCPQLRPAVVDRPSANQFADYQIRRGLFGTRV